MNHKYPCKVRIKLTWDEKCNLQERKYNSPTLKTPEMPKMPKIPRTIPRTEHGCVGLGILGMSVSLVF